MTSFLHVMALPAQEMSTFCWKETSQAKGVRGLTHWAARYTDILVESCSQGLLQLDHSYRILQANRKAAIFFGARKSEDLIGLVLHASDGGEGIRLEPRFISPEFGDPLDGSYTASTRFGAELPVEIAFLPLPEGDDSGASWLALLTDLTVRVNLERECLQAEKLAAMDNVVAGIAHELNNPMTAILGYAELLLSSEMEPRRKQRAALIAEEADRCAKIIANMLTFTRSYGKKLESVNLNSLVEEVVSLRAYQMRVDHIKIHAYYDRAVPIILAQPDAIRRLFLNLVHNAHQALLEVPESRRNLWVMTGVTEEAIHIQVADNGSGIPETVRYKIFDPFFSTRPFGEGMGLGLSVAYGIAHEHKGRIWMEPRVGGGTSMNVELPLPKPAS